MHPDDTSAAPLDLREVDQPLPGDEGDDCRGPLTGQQLPQLECRNPTAFGGVPRPLQIRHGGYPG